GRALGRRSTFFNQSADPHLSRHDSLCAEHEIFNFAARVLQRREGNPLRSSAERALRGRGAVVKSLDRGRRVPSSGNSSVPTRARPAPAQRVAQLGRRCWVRWCSSGGETRGCRAPSRDQVIAYSVAESASERTVPAAIAGLPISSSDEIEGATSIGLIRCRYIPRRTPWPKK